MASRKSRRGSQQSGTKMKTGAKRQLVIMIISIALMVFSVTQVYYLARYTLGYEVDQKDMSVYTWFYKLLEAPEATQE